MASEWRYEKEIRVELPTSVRGTLLGVPLEISLVPKVGADGPAKVSGGFEWECRRKKTSGNECESELRAPRRIGPKIATAFEPEPYESANIGAQALAALTQAFGITPEAEVTVPTIRLSPDLDVINDGTKCVRVFVKTRIEYDPGKVKVKFNLPIPGFQQLEYSTELKIGSPIDSTWEAVYAICCCECLNEVPVYDEQRDGDYQDYEGEVVEDGQLNCKFEHSVTWESSQGGRERGAKWKITADEGPCCRNIQVTVLEDGTLYRVIPGSKAGASHTPETP